MHTRSLRGFVGALVLALATPAAAERVHAHDDFGAIPASLAPARWSTGDGVGMGRTGDVRPEALAILDALERADAPLTYAEIAGGDQIDGAIAHLVMPATIRVWRRGLDGSTASCSGRVDVI